jgi:hypothetical protein
VYYIFANTNAGPYVATEPLLWLTTPDYSYFNLVATNQPINASGIFQFPGAVSSPLSISPGSFHLTGQGAAAVASFGFTNLTGQSFSVLSSPSLATPVASWSVVGTTVETPPDSGQYQFTDPTPATNGTRFYMLRQP